MLDPLSKSAPWTTSDQAAFVREFIRDYLDVQLQTRRILLEDFWELESGLAGAEFDARCTQPAFLHAHKLLGAA